MLMWHSTSKMHLNFVCLYLANREKTNACHIELTVAKIIYRILYKLLVLQIPTSDELRLFPFYFQIILFVLILSLALISALLLNSSFGATIPSLIPMKEEGDDETICSIKAQSKFDRVCERFSSIACEQCSNNQMCHYVYLT